MKLPERIFGVGGAGKAIAFELLEADWILEGILEPKPNPASLQVTIIDTATGEQNSDRQRIQSIRERINELRTEMREKSAPNERIGDISIDYVLVTENIRLNSGNDLLGERAVPRITAGNGMDEEDWWLEPEYINENLDFARGVVRKRGLGKAIFYKAYAEDDSLSTYVDLPDKGKVAIFSGLGGGTGSSIFFDIAEHLKSQMPTAEITLFGVLPNHTEGDEESANAYAALSELEYMALEDDTEVFKDRVLIPIDPTGFGGKKGDRIQSDDILKELDQAILYLLVAYYNNEGLEDPFEDTPDYAPFTMGVPQVLRYNVEAINDARQALRDILEQKEGALQAERELYDEIERFLAKHYSADVESGLRDLDRADLADRLEKAKELLELDLFEQLEYESLSIFQDILTNAEEEAEDVVDEVEIIASNIRAGVASGQSASTFRDDIDEHLAEILERHLQLIGRRKDIFEQKTAIDDNQIRETVEFLMASGDGTVNPGVKLRRLETRLEDLEEERERRENEQADLEAELERLRDEQSEQVNQKLDSWERSVTEQFETLQAIDVAEIEDDCSTLKNQLTRYKNEIENASVPEEVEQVTTGQINDTLDSLQSELEKLGIDFGGEREDVTASLNWLAQAKKAFLDMNEDESLVESISPFKSSTEEKKEDARRDYRMQSNKLDDAGVFSTGTPTGSFSATIEYSNQSIVSKVRDRERELQDQVVAEFKERLVDPSRPQVRDLETEVSAENGPDFGRAQDIVREGFRNEIGGTDEVERDLEEVREELSSVEARIETTQAAVDLFQDMNNRRDAFTDKQEAFYDRLAEYDEGANRSGPVRSDSYAYVKTFQPEEVFRATGDADIAESGILKSQQEQQRIRQGLEELASNARNHQYNGIRRRKFSKGRSRYDGINVRVAVTSRGHDQINDQALQFQELFGDAFDIEPNSRNQRFTTWMSDVGDSWDIGLSVFIDGIFLDNIRKVVQPDGYHRGYENCQQAQDIVVRHSYGLDDGYFVRRDELLNIENDDGVGFYLRPDQEVKADLKGEKLVKVPTREDDDTDDAADEPTGGR